MRPILKTLENGMRLVFQKVEKNKPASIYIAIDTGSKNEDEKNSGISHFIEHLNFKGTEKRNAKEISTQFEEIGAVANAFTSKSITCFYASTLPEKFEECLEILGDIVFNSKYAESDIEKERKVIYEEIDMYQDDPESVCYEEFCRVFYKNTNLERQIIGTKESLKNISRKDILDYFSKYYVAQNTVVCVVGNLSLPNVKKLVKKYVKCQKSNEDFGEKIKSSVVIPDKDFSFISKDVKQTQISFGFPCDNIFSQSKTNYNLMSFIFGGGMGSRLFQKVREENGFVYSISCQPEFYENGGNLLIDLATNKTNEKKAMELIKEEIDKFVAEGITEKELERAKIFYKSILLSGSEKGSNLAKIYASSVIVNNKIETIDNKVQEIENATVEDINNIIKKVFNYQNVCGCSLSKQPDESLFNVFN